jgi:hypothetical protein
MKLTEDLAPMIVRSHDEHLTPQATEPGQSDHKRASPDMTVSIRDGRALSQSVD